MNGTETCTIAEADLKGQQAVVLLDHVYWLYHRQCYQELIRVGTAVRQIYRDKYYSVSREAGELLLNEGQNTDYVMDAFERGHLSYMIALSYFRMGHYEDSRVELRRAQEEMRAQIHRSGEDSLNNLLIGHLWENLKSKESAIVSYRKVLSDPNARATSHLMARNRIDLLEKATGKPAPALHVYEIGAYPNIVFNSRGRYSMEYPANYSLLNCASISGYLVNVDPWTQQFTQREEVDEERDVVKYKKLLRTPATLFYAGSVLVIGGAITLAIGSVDTDGRVTAFAAILTLGATKRTYEMGYAPDMRYWGHLPSAFIFSTHENPELEPCVFRYAGEEKLKPVQLF